jgi:hypothetical protein
VVCGKESGISNWKADHHNCFIFSVHSNNRQSPADYRLPTATPG